MDCRSMITFVLILANTSDVSRLTSAFLQLILFSRTLAKFAELEEEDDFTELVNVPLILAQVEHQVAPIPPELPKHKVPDIFERLVSLLKHYIYVPFSTVFDGKHTSCQVYM